MSGGLDDRDVMVTTGVQVLHPGPTPRVANVNFAFDGRMLLLSNIAQVNRGFTDPPQPMFRVNGKPIGLGAALKA